jgi:hypothetical protein
MLGWLWKLIVGNFTRCDHSWKIIKEVRCSDEWQGSWTRYHLQCGKCGDVKCKDMD